ncbi:DNA helicase, partial [Tanacetum coccineum]
MEAEEERRKAALISYVSTKVTFEANIYQVYMMLSQEGIEKLGIPQYFITFACNMNWPEIKRYMEEYPQLTPADIPDIVCRVFEQKKRGLPHCHTLLWVDSKDKIENAKKVDHYVSAELPDPGIDPTRYKIVSDLMMHGPCGIANSSAPCMKIGPCNKRFHKKYNDETYFDSNVHVHYRKKDTSVYTIKHESEFNKSYVVPYNRTLCLAFEVHINVEYCDWSMLIKYLFKYISKGPDRIIAKISKPIGESAATENHQQEQVDEIQNFVDGRYICPHEACWRIFDFPIHSREPGVQILAVHLENMQRINFHERERLSSIVNFPERLKTTLTEWFAYNDFHEDGYHLTYLDFPSEYVWYADQKSLRRRRILGKKSIGRLTYVHPSSGELFYLRMLLCQQKGRKSFLHMQTVNDQLLPTFRAACEALGLLGDDKEWAIALEESSISATSSELRLLFAQILIYCDVADPLKLWTKHWQLMRDDIPTKISEATRIQNFHINNPELQGCILYEIESILNGFGKSVKEFDGSLSRYKARLVANGRSQQQGIDCDETFSPVVKPATIRTVLSLAVSRDWPIHQLDVKNAFLHGHLSETVYMHQPPGFVDPNKPNYVCHLQRSLYGLKQAPRAWFQRFASYATRVDFQHSKTDSSLFVFHRGSDIAYLLLYVDDIILTASSSAFLQRIITSLHSEFAMTDLGSLNYFLGISAQRSATGLF